MRRLAVILACLVAVTTLPAQPPEAPAPELRPALSIFLPAKDDDGLGEQAAVGEVVAVPVKASGLSGSFASREASGDYEMTLTHPEPQRVAVEFRFTWTGRPDALIAALGVRVPFDFGDDPRRLKVAVGSQGRPRGEVWWVDSNDMQHPGWMLADREERWPLWRLGGIFQDASDHYVVWKANRADTAPVVVDENRLAPGWLDVSGATRGVTVIWDEMPSRAPCAISVNWPARAIDVWFHPPAAGARRPESLGLLPGKPVTWKFTLAYHDDVFPAAHRPELAREAYAELLRLVDAQGLWAYVADNYRIRATPPGPRVPSGRGAGDLDERVRRAIDTGIAPSELLRAFDSGDAWRMKRLCAAVGATHSDDHAANVKAVLDWCIRQAKEEPKG